MQPGFLLPAASTLTRQTASNGVYTYPPTGSPVTVPVSGVLYLNITATACSPTSNSALPLPEGLILKPHYYFAARPALSTIFSEWESRDWSVHLGMGWEASGWAIAGVSWFLMHHLLIASNANHPITG